MKIGCVLIDYFSYERTTQYINDFYYNVNIDNKNIIFVVVDNSCNSENFNHLKVCVEHYLGKKINPIVCEGTTKAYRAQGQKQIILLQSEKNGGFAHGNNLGAKFIKNHGGADYLLFTNNDIIFNQKCDLVQMEADFERNLNVGIWGPAVIGLDGKAQSPQQYMSIWSRWIIPEFIWPLNYHIPFLKNVGKTQELIYSQTPCEAYRVIGAFMAVRASVFYRIGMFDENTFLYAEELILSEKIQKEGYTTWYNPNVVVIHEGGYTTHRKANDEFVATDRRLASELYYYHKYRNVSSWKIELTKIVYIIYKFKVKLLDLVKRKVNFK